MPGDVRESATSQKTAIGYKLVIASQVIENSTMKSTSLTSYIPSTEGASSLPNVNFYPLFWRRRCLDSGLPVDVPNDVSVSSEEVLFQSRRLDVF